ncbi:MAG: hypothetical protein HFI85_02690 [Clostridia bacterium]|jgi:3-methyladenine DNA glycosylase AlkD|nr:hypothetical protein [Clostridia bacterium]
MLEEEIKEFIATHTDEKKARFDEGLISSSYEIKGISMSDMNAYAKELAKRGVDIEKMPLSCHEEILLAGMTLAYSKLSPKDKVEKLKKLLPYIDNWATCDMIVSRLKGIESEREFFIELLHSNRPFYIRVGIVWLMKFELKKDVIKTVNLLNDNVKNTNYYVEMALAWCYAEAMIVEFDYMIEFVQRLERYVVRNRTLQKATESFRISDERKKEVRALRSRLLGMEI